MEKRLQEERDVFDFEKKRLQTDFESENSMQKKIINRLNKQGTQKEELYGNRVAKLIDKVEELKRINNNNNNNYNNNNNDVSNYFDFDHSLDEKQKELLN